MEDIKLTLTTDTTLDMLPLFVDIMDKLELKDRLATMKKGETAEEAKTVGFDLMFYVLRGIPRVKPEILQLLALAAGTTAEEIGKQHPAKTIAQLKALFSDVGAVELFKSVM